MRLIVFASILLTAACTSAAPGTPVVAPPLRPYLTSTPSPTLDHLPGLVSAETPLPSPTPSQYTIKSGDTLSQLAERFRISLDSLLAANPNLDPNALRVGDSIRIPSSPADHANETPTAVPLAVQQVVCYPTANGAVWCFALVYNDTPETIENVTALITLVDSAGSAISSKTALLPLDTLQPGASLPLSALFPPPVPLDVKPQVRILTAIQLLPDDKRYLPAVIRRTLTEVSWSGHSAEASGEIFLPAEGTSASVVWLAAVAYDASGSIVGWRRWESTTGLAAGSSLPFELIVASAAGRIDRVDFAVQARP